MKTSIDLIIDAIEAITKAGSSPRTLMDMSLSEAIVTLHKNGLHLTFVDVNEKPEKVDNSWISNIGRNKDGHPDNLGSFERIEVKFRNGDTRKGNPLDWDTWWNEVFNDYDFTIVAYRILKD
jgi:hypothetical protein